MDKLQASTIVFRGKSMEFDPTNFCRCCLTNSESLIPMASTDPANGNSFQQLYDSLCSITLQLGGESKICESCVFDLQMATQFKLMCRQATNKVKEIVLANLKKSKPNEELQSVVPEKVQKKDNTVTPSVSVPEKPKTSVNLTLQKKINESIKTILLRETQNLSEVFEPPLDIKKEPVEQEPTVSNHVLASFEPVIVIVKTEKEPITIEPVAVKTEEELTIVDNLATEFQDNSATANMENEENMNLDDDKDSTGENDTLVEYTYKSEKEQEGYPTKYVPDTLTCERCGMSFKTRSRFKDHLQNHGRRKLVPEFKCETCGRTHKNKSALKFHRISEHKTLNYSSYCKYHKLLFPDCDYKCSSRHVYRSHLAKIHEKKYEEVFDFIVENKIQPNLLKPASKIEEPEDQKPADEIKEAKVKKPNILKRTTKVVPPIRKLKFKCDICGCAQENARALKNHRIREHNEVLTRPYLKYHELLFPDCNFKGDMRGHLTCDHHIAPKQVLTYRKAQYQERQQHQQTPSQLQKSVPNEVIIEIEDDEPSTATNKPNPILDLECHRCGKTFQNPHNFEDHIYIDGFVYKRNMSRRFKSGIYKCADCETSFHTQISLTTHRQMTHKKFECCFYAYDCSTYYPKCLFKSHNMIPFEQHTISIHNKTFDQIMADWKSKQEIQQGKPLDPSNTYERWLVPEPNTPLEAMPDNDPLN